MTGMIEVASCRWCQRGTVQPKSDKCCHCGEGLYPVTVMTPLVEIIAVVVRDGEFAAQYEQSHLGLTRRGGGGFPNAKPELMPVRGRIKGGRQRKKKRVRHVAAIERQLDALCAKLGITRRDAERLCE